MNKCCLGQLLCLPGLCLVSALLCVQPVCAQAYEVHLAGMRGFGSSLVTGGFSFGGGVLFRDRIGFEADYSWLGDKNDGVAPVLGLGGTGRLMAPRRVVPFVSGGFLRLGDLGDVYGGGGINIRLSPRSAIRVELRGVAPVADYRGCVPNCATPSDAWMSLRIGVAFGPGS